MRTLFALGIAAGVALLVSCSGQPPVTEEEGTVAAGYGRVFGRVQYSYNGEPMELGFAKLGLARHDVTLLMRPAGVDELHYMRPEADGTFSWPLKPGNYVLIGITAFHSDGAFHEGTSRRYMAPITVVAPGTALYIGDIRVRASRARYSMELVDEYDETLKRMQPRLASGKFQPAKALLEPEPPAGKYKSVRPICAAFWQLTCSGVNQGVELVAPVGTGPFAPTTESLTPLLEWKPSPRKDVSYDVVIYESISFHNQLTGERVAQMLGPRVAYAEGVTESKFVPGALAPGKKYAWSVRLRNGETVSTWSSLAFSMNLIIAASSRSELFSFQTPSK